MLKMTNTSRRCKVSLTLRSIFIFILGYTSMISQNRRKIPMASILLPQEVRRITCDMPRCGHIIERISQQLPSTNARLSIDRAMMTSREDLSRRESAFAFLRAFREPSSAIPTSAMNMHPNTSERGVSLHGRACTCAVKTRLLLFPFSFPG